MAVIRGTRKVIAGYMIGGVNSLKNTKDFYNATVMDWAKQWYEDETMLPYLTKFMSYMPQKPAVLDLCCGAGYESMRLARLGAEVTGLDFSEESIRIAREKNQGIRFVVEDMLNDYSYLGKFDGCVVIAGLVHLPNEKLSLAFDRVHAVLKENGLLLIVVKDGNGKSPESSYKSIGGEDYDRDFYLHSLEELTKYSSGSFKFGKELMPDEKKPWKCYIFRKL